jgi:hypothetical protein
MSATETITGSGAATSMVGLSFSVCKAATFTGPTSHFKYFYSFRDVPRFPPVYSPKTTRAVCRILDTVLTDGWAYRLLFSDKYFLAVVAVRGHEVLSLAVSKNKKWVTRAVFEKSGGGPK